jgi:PHAX RNA-binding domain
MPRKSREREREQLRKESKRQRVDVAERAEGAQAPQDAAVASAPAPAPDPAALQLVDEIAAQLGETEDEPRATILRAVVQLGADAALALLRDAQAVEAGGGMWLGDGSRRRTPGGVFFYLLRQRTEKPDRLAIFYPEYQQIEPLTDDELRGLLADALDWPRATPQQARLRLAGRPSKIPPPDLAPETPYVIFNLASDVEHMPPLSSAMPPVGVATTYRVLASTAQWRKIAPALVQRPDARIGIVGTMAINPKRPGVITVRAAGLKLLVPRVDEVTSDE